MPKRSLRQKRIKVIATASALAVLFLFAVPTTIEDFFFPGSQPGESGSLEGPSKCASCHGGYDIGVEPLFNWTGSMMAQAARDPLYEACLAISNQDVPDSGDLCIRCHSPEGWLGGRSTPTSGTELLASDLEGIHCGFCHRLVKPSQPGVNPYPDDTDYLAITYTADQAYLAKMSSLPQSVGNGGYIVDDDNTRRGPFATAGAKHTFYYSPYHSESALCGTCHDVSNPAFDRNPDGTYTLNDFNLAAPSFNTYDLFPVERTYSEWLMSEYNSETGVYAPEFGGNKDYVRSCQDCHMKDITGKATSHASAFLRDDLPHHDMTGGNTFMPEIIKTLFSGVNAAALDSGISRARYMLQHAATLELALNPTGDDVEATVTVYNNTGHKLPSGYPEGRRIWINLVAKNEAGTIVFESGGYDETTGFLTDEAGSKVYQIKPGMDEAVATATGNDPGPSFHFVLNNKIFSDNRIPPRGFTNAAFEAIQSPPVNYSYADGQYWDISDYSLPLSTALVEVKLFYQTLSGEYVTFLRDENNTNTAGQELYDLWSTHGKSAPELMASVTMPVYPTGSEDLRRDKPVIYPNPASERFYISLADSESASTVRVTLINQGGQIVRNNEEITLMSGLAEVNAAGLAPGRYTCLVSSATGRRIFAGAVIIRR